MTVPSYNGLALDVLASLRFAENHGYDIPAAIILGVSNVSPLVERRQYVIVKDYVQVKLGSILQGVCFLVVVNKRLLDLGLREVEELDACVIHILFLLCCPTFNFLGDECPDRESSLALYGLSFLFLLLFLLRLLLHLCHLLIDELLVLVRVLLRHVVQLLPHEFHLLGVDSRRQTPLHASENSREALT